MRIAVIALLGLLLSPAVLAEAQASEAPDLAREDALALVEASERGDLPEAWGARSPDGHFVLVIHAPVAWQAAELSVVGSDAVDFGPVRRGDRVRVDGLVDDKKGPLRIGLMAATEDGTGITWYFSVDPDTVPVGSPELRDAKPRRKSLLRLFRRRS